MIEEIINEFGLLPCRMKLLFNHKKVIFYN